MTAENWPSNPPDTIREEFLATGDAAMALAERSLQVDQTVLSAAADLLFAGGSSGVAVLAVGGYGRRELFPFSDVDLLLLFESEDLAHERKPAIAAFLQTLWDAGLRVSHSVRTPAECAEVHDRNIELNISLLDQRYLAGNRALYATLADRLPRFLKASRDTLIRHLARLARERHARYGNTLYHLEPDVKETPGGLRDHQLLRWLDRLHEFDPVTAGPDEEVREFQWEFQYLARVRCQLHYLAGRDNNKLSFDTQDVLAERSRQGDAARWMREYYRHARSLYRAAMRALDSAEAQSGSLLAQFRDWRGRLSNADFGVHRERAHFRSPGQLDAEPELALRLFEFTARHGIRPSQEAERQIETRLGAFRRYFASSRPVWRQMESLLSLPQTPLALRSMEKSGLLTALFPEFQGIECLVVRDFFHRYTVDEHTFVAMQSLWDLRAATEDWRRPFANLLAEIERLAPLAFALLFHDAGKACEVEGHVPASVRLAREASMRVQAPDRDRETMLFLISRHLELSAALHLRDVFDPQTVFDLAGRIGTVERLKLLVLVTYADISAVNPAVMTPWRAQQLWQLYLAIYNQLTRELETDRIGAPVSAPPRRADFLRGLPTRYLRTHSENEIEDHMALETRSREHGAAVETRKLDSVWQLTLAAADSAGLFASAAGTLSSFGMNILKAEAFGNRRGLVLDTFTFQDPHRTLDLNPSEVERLNATLRKVLARKLDVRALLRNRPKPVLPSRKARVRPSVSFNAEASDTATLIEIVAEDRPGLLYELASALSGHGANIEVVLIDTEAHKAIDVFYVTAEGGKLTPERQQAIETALRLVCEPK